MSAKQYQAAVASYYARRFKEILHLRNNLCRDDLEYVTKAAAKLKDERLKACIATLIGWGDDDRAELETGCAIAVEVFKHCAPSVLREAARTVEVRYLVKLPSTEAEENFGRSA